MSVTNSWIGATTDTKVRANAKVTESSVQLAIAPQADPTNWSFYAPVSASAQGVVDLSGTGLDPATPYKWAIQGDAFEEQGIFRTHPPVGDPASFTFAAFSCAGSSPAFPGNGDELAPNRISNHPAFDDVRTQSPLFVAHMGDATYYNLGQGSNTAGAATVANYRTMYDDILDQPRQHHLYRDVPLVYTWDDHDFGPNNSDGTHAGKQEAAQVYRERVPSYDLAESSGPIYHSFQVGRVLFVASDVRYNRSPNSDPDTSSKTMLGSTQKTWMNNLLASSSAEALVWIMPQTWLGLGSDSWNSFQTERAELVAMFGDNGWLGRMCAISGDLHALAMSTGTGNPYGGFPIFQFASIDSQYLGALTTQYNLGATGGRERYGTMRVADDGDVVRVTGTGWIGANVWQSHTWTSTLGVPLVPVLGLDYAGGDVAPPFEPVEGDQQLANDVTAEQDQGSSARVVKETGSLAVSEIGRYNKSVTVNVNEEVTLVSQAGWRVHLGTVDEPRYPKLTVNLLVNEHLRADVADVDSGDLVEITNVPDWLPPGDIDALAIGYEERLNNFEWQWTGNMAPASPWIVAVVSDEVLGRLDSVDSTLTSDITDSDAVFFVTVPGAQWITTNEFPGQFPFDIEIGGELMRVTALNLTSPQEFHVTRSINGVVKAHAAGTRVSLAQSAVIAL